MRGVKVPFKCNNYHGFNGNWLQGKGCNDPVKYAYGQIQGFLANSIQYSGHDSSATNFPQAINGLAYLVHPKFN